MQECHGDIAHKGARHHELLCRQAALSQTKEHIQSLAKRVDSITDIWLAASRKPSDLFVARCILTFIMV